MNLQSFFLRAGLAAATAGAAGYAALATLLPSPVPTAPAPATQVAATSAVAPAAAPPPSAAGRPPPHAVAAAPPPMFFPAMPASPPRIARRLAEPAMPHPSRAVASAPPRPVERPHPASHAVRTEATAPAPAYEVYYPVQMNPYSGRWTYRRVY